MLLLLWNPLCNVHVLMNCFLFPADSFLNFVTFVYFRLYCLLLFVAYFIPTLSVSIWGPREACWKKSPPLFKKIALFMKESRLCLQRRGKCFPHEIDLIRSSHLLSLSSSERKSTIFIYSLVSFRPRDVCWQLRCIHAHFCIFLFQKVVRWWGTMWLARHMTRFWAISVRCEFCFGGLLRNMPEWSK